MAADRRTEAGTSAPPYPFQFSGPVLVCGNAWCLADDMRRARMLYPAAPVIAVNGASGNVPAMALFSLHPDKMEEWSKQQEAKFGTRASTHGIATIAKANRNRERMPWIDYWWQSSAKGTSTWAARKIATFMGFETVVLCGMPLETGSYQGGKMAKLFQQQSVIDHFRKMIRHDTAWHDEVYSMSGWTRDLLGAPPGELPNA